SLRRRGLFLAHATFGFGLLAQYLLFPAALSFGVDALAPVARPAWFRGDLPFHYLVLAVAAVGVLAVETVRVTRLGRIVRALGDSPSAVESLGIEPVVSRVLIFCLAAFLAAVGGGLVGSLIGTVAPGSFDFFQSLVWPAVLTVAGPFTLGGSILAAILLVALPGVVSSASLTEWLPVVFGLGCIVFARSNNGVAGLVSAGT